MDVLLKASALTRGSACLHLNPEVHGNMRAQSPYHQLRLVIRAYEKTRAYHMDVNIQGSAPPESQKQTMKDLLQVTLHQPQTYLISARNLPDAGLNLFCTSLTPGSKPQTYCSVRTPSRDAQERRGFGGAGAAPVEATLSKGFISVNISRKFKGHGPPTQ